MVDCNIILLKHTKFFVTFVSISAGLTSRAYESRKRVQEDTRWEAMINETSSNHMNEKQNLTFLSFFDVFYQDTFDVR